MLLERRVQMPEKRTGSDDWSQRRTRYDPPVLEEAIIAAQGLTDEIAIQTEIAAQLMGLSEDEVRSAVLKAATQPQSAGFVPAPARQHAKRTVLVERRGSRSALK